MKNFAIVFGLLVFQLGFTLIFASDKGFITPVVAGITAGLGLLLIAVTQVSNWVKWYWVSLLGTSAMLSSIGLYTNFDRILLSSAFEVVAGICFISSFLIAFPSKRRAA
jgi:hypothetical protein